MRPLLAELFEYLDPMVYRKRTRIQSRADPNTYGHGWLDSRFELSAAARRGEIAAQALLSRNGCRSGDLPCETPAVRVGFLKLVYLWQRNRKVGPVWKLVKRTSLLQ